MKKKVSMKGRGGVPCCGRGGVPEMMPVVQKRFFGGLAEKVGTIMAKGAVEDIVGATAKAHGYRKGGMVVPSVF